jgi:hypothetical protein
MVWNASFDCVEKHENHLVLQCVEAKVSHLSAGEWIGNLQPPQGKAF